MLASITSDELSAVGLVLLRKSARRNTVAMTTLSREQNTASTSRTQAHLITVGRLIIRDHKYITVISGRFAKLLYYKHFSNLNLQ